MSDSKEKDLAVQLAYAQRELRQFYRDYSTIITADKLEDLLRAAGDVAWMKEGDKVTHHAAEILPYAEEFIRALMAERMRSSCLEVERARLVNEVNLLDSQLVNLSCKDSATRQLEKLCYRQDISFTLLPFCVILRTTQKSLLTVYATPADERDYHNADDCRYSFVAGSDEQPATLDAMILMAIMKYPECD